MSCLSEGNKLLFQKFEIESRACKRVRVYACANVYFMHVCETQYARRTRTHARVLACTHLSREIVHVLDRSLDHSLKRLLQRDRTRLLFQTFSRSIARSPAQSLARRLPRSFPRFFACSNACWLDHSRDHSVDRLIDPAFGRWHR